jgi:hypothetical protein
MTTAENTTDLEESIAQWRSHLQKRPEVHARDVDELEDHLRDRIAELTERGLHDDEAFLVAVKRLGRLDELAREYAHEHSDRLWKQLVLTGETETALRERRRDFVAMAACAALAAVVLKLPLLAGVDFDSGTFYPRNFGIFALAPLALYLGWRRRVGLGVMAVIAALFAVGAGAVNLYPLKEESQVFVVSLLHLIPALWVAVGLAYMGGEWRSSAQRMNFLRFTGEWFIYMALIALGGGVLSGVTIGLFESVGLEADVFVGEWMIPCGAVGAVVVAAWLVEAKQGVVENMAPVLTRLFTPLFTGTLVIFLGVLAATRSVFSVEREVLILIDLLLVVVLGLLLYALSARGSESRPGWFDRMQLVLVIAALVIDGLVLAAMMGRITTMGFTPNKTAALGENILLLVNLAVSAWLLLGFLRGRALARLERWHTAYLTLFAAWFWVVVLVFPPLFRFA